ncbi:MAG: lipopolysaccharide heptosyltransferase II [Gemmatimonadota bacterium]|nr:MAG: lipopolysaccharide heptosyltransferase II [Gemmatimonadota bacterium]
MSEPRVYARAPNHLGDVVMAIPALRRLAERYPESGVDVWCPAAWAPVLEAAGLPAEVMAFRRTRAIWRTAARLRDVGYDAAYLFPPSFSSAAVVRLAGIARRRGTPTDGRGLLLTDRSVRPEAPGEHRVSFYMRLVDPGWKGGEPPVPRLPVQERALEQFRQLVEGRFERPAVAIFPSSYAPARRWPEGKYTALAGLLGQEVGTVVVFGGSGEEVLAARVAAGAGKRGIDLGGRTSLAVLAAGLSECDLVVSNDSGPMHLAAAVGAPLIAIFGSSDPKHTGPLGTRARVLWRSELPCAPCRKNRCRRRGQGTYLPEAQDECVHLITVEAVARAARQQMSQARTASDV